MAEYSYAEAYTRYIIYISDKYKKSEKSVVDTFRQDGTEQRFKDLYMEKPDLTNAGGKLNVISGFTDKKNL